MGRKKILFIATGGTFSSVKTADGIKPGFGVQEMIDKFPEAQAFADITGVQLCHLDSTNVQPSDWTNFSRCVFEHYDGYDGFVIGHGTDTMAYTAAGLSFALAGVRKPIVMTGSALSADHPETDARENFIDSIIAATSPFIQGVSVCFAGRVIKGTNAHKAAHDADSGRNHIDLFNSMNAPLMARIKNGGIEINSLYRRFNDNSGHMPLNANFDTNIGSLMILPGMGSDVLNSFEHKKAVIIQAFGDGGIPFVYGSWIEKIEEMKNKGIPVFVVSQTGGAADMSSYEVGIKAQKAGAISCEDMTFESVVAKLMWISGNFPLLKNTAFINKFKENIAGEFYARSPS